MSDFTDRLLDASLKEYSRVDAPDGFALRERRPRAMWAWVLIPALAAVVVIAMRPAPLPVAPTFTAMIAAPVVTREATYTSEKKKVKPAVHYRTLTGVEIAKLEMLPALFAPAAEDKPIAALEIAPLESANPVTESKENQ